MGNLEIYEKVRNVPENAKRKIVGGRLKGMTDINPMWRIKILTEQFGICGIGWRVRIVRTWVDCGVNNEVAAHVEIELFIKVDGAWSEAIPGIGGSKFVSKESGGLYTDDDCYKKAYTDALSVACKLLGIGANVYWDKDNTKYYESRIETFGKNAAKNTPNLHKSEEVDKHTDNEEETKQDENSESKEDFRSVFEEVQNEDLTNAENVEIVYKNGTKERVGNLPIVWLRTLANKTEEEYKEAREAAKTILKLKYNEIV